MEDLLREVSALLVDFPAEQHSLARALDLADRVGSTDRHEPLSETEEALRSECLATLARTVAPPAELFYYDPDVEAADLPPPRARTEFLRRIGPSERLLASLLRLGPLTEDAPSREELAIRANLVLAFGRYDASVASLGVSVPRSDCSAIVSSLIEQPASARLPLARYLLTVSLPPYFKPHPKVNPNTGRVLSRPLGGDRALNSWFESSEADASSWRQQVGLAAVVNRVLQALQPGEVEDLWPFLLPPLLAYLEDFESANKLKGILLLDTLLSRVDASLLRRTGVGKVFERSLEACFSALSDPNTPRLLAAAHPVALRLADLQFPPPRPSDPDSADEARFTALYRLFTSSVIYAWEFKGQNAAIETVTARALPPLLDALGASSIRYLQLLAPHLCDLVGSTATVGDGGIWTLETAEMMLEASRALRAVVRNAKLRMARWEGRIGGAVVQCWVARRESPAARELEGGSKEGRDLLERLNGALRDLLAALEGVGSISIAARLSGHEELAGLLPGPPAVPAAA
ncbi:hypothetical protein JCM8202_003739 [Rhodotorula sphaerocarpa]